MTDSQVDLQRIMDSRKSEIEVMHSLSSIVGTNLDRKTVAILLQLLEQGFHPESLADSKSF